MRHFPEFHGPQIKGPDLILDANNESARRKRGYSIGIGKRAFEFFNRSIADLNLAQNIRFVRVESGDHDQARSVDFMAIVPRSPVIETRDRPG